MSSKSTLKSDSLRSSEVVPQKESDKKCAPGNMFTSGSCINLDVLIHMAGAYNTTHTQNPIKLSTNLETLNRNKYKKYLLNEMNKRLKDVCDSQTCWSKQSFIKNMKKHMRHELQKLTFRPDGPGGKFEWLNTININEVLLQYEKQHPDFKFLGAVPIDFDDFPSLGLKDLDIDCLIKNGKTKLGIVFNLDESYKSGSHWVAFYADLDKKHVYYYDSYGTKPDERIQKFMRRVANYCKNNLKCDSVVADYNKIRHQYGGSECGVYSIYFINRLLNGESFKKICESKTTDEEVNQYRKIYFK
jgi:hypothetical protein